MLILAAANKVALHSLKEVKDLGLSHEARSQDSCNQSLKEETG